MLVFVVISCSICIIMRLFLCVVMQVLVIFVVKVTLLRMLRSDAGVYPVYLRLVCGPAAWKKSLEVRRRLVGYLKFFFTLVCQWLDVISGDFRLTVTRLLLKTLA